MALFVGPTLTGIDGRATRIFNFGDFERSFGGLSPTSSLSYSVLHFFANGGGEAFVIRVPAAGSLQAATSFKQDGASAVSMSVKALGSGAAGKEIYVEIDPFEIGANPYLSTKDTTRFNLSMLDRLSGRTERFADLRTTGGARYGPDVVNDIATGSKLASLTVATGVTVIPKPTGSVYEIGNIPAASSTGFAESVAVKLSVTVFDAAGTTAASAAFPDLTVTVFNKNDPIPATALEAVTRLATAINAAIAANATAKAAMEGVPIEAALFENGRLFRLRTAAPGPQALTRRLADATVTIAGTTSAGPTVLESFFAAALFNVTVRSENSSRYGLGASYGPAAGSQVTALVVGNDGSATGQPATADFQAAITALDVPDPFFNILCLPDLVRPSAADPNALQHAAAMAAYGEAARVCKNKFAFLLVDPFPSTVDVVAAEAWKTLAFTFQSSHAAAYFPNIKVDDPLVAGSVLSHPPSGAMAGVFARTDGNVGVWQSPAGTEASLTGVYGPSPVLSDDEHGILNPLGLNVIRQFPIYGTVAFGARTLDGSNAAASEWKYIAVRRTALFMLRSLSEGLRWAVRRGNGEVLWADLRMNVNSFMQGLFRQGAFKGSSKNDAYFVRCDASTTSQPDIDNGIVNIVIGFAPLKPAEFVVISLQQMVKQAA
ncbi:MAG TPA: phage tail sheath C-terminal domain-containing protein [Allosphingosinicella sp.]